MADVGLIGVGKAILICLVALSMFALQGCNGGEITPEMQKAKNDGLAKASEKEGSVPAERRPD